MAMIVAAAPAAAEPSDASLPTYDGDLTFLPIESAAGPEDYSWRVELRNGETLQSVSGSEAQVVNESGMTGLTIVVEKAHDAHGTEVPTTLEVSEEDVLTLVVHHREGAFVYPVRPGQGFTWSDPTIITGPPDEAQIAEEKRRIEEAARAAVVPPPVLCRVPMLQGLSLRGAKQRLHAAHCGVGQVHLAADETRSKGKVVRQFRAAGTELAAGTPVAMKLGSNSPRPRATAVASVATAEERDSAPPRPISESGMYFPKISGPTAPEKYPIQFELDEGQTLHQVDEHEVVVENPGGEAGLRFTTPLAHDAEGVNVPTTIVLSGGDLVTIVVPHRAGNPAGGGAPFRYPIVAGAGWLGGFHTTVVEMNNPNGPPVEPIPGEPLPACLVPSVRGLPLHAAKARLRAAHCGVGQVHLAPEATAAKGKVVKQFRPTGSELAAGAPVAVKLGSR